MAPLSHIDSPQLSWRIPAAANACIVIAQMAGLTACFLLASQVTAWWWLAALSIAFAVLMNSVYSVIHEAEHGILFPHRGWNDGVGIFMALFFPAPFHLLRQGHLGHHLRNRSDDEAFDFYFEDSHRLWRTLVLYGILTGFYWLVVVSSNVVMLVFPFATHQRYWKFDRPSEAFMESLNPRYRAWIRCECLAVLGLHAFLVLGLSIPWIHYVAMYLAFGFTWSAMQYVHHYGTERHVTRGARNLWLWGPLDRVWLHHNWHLTHHEHPTVPWIHLPRLASSEPSPRRFLPWAYLQMWRGPRRSTHRVKNRYAGRVIR